jgi:Fe-S-cluster containining protein
MVETFYLHLEFGKKNHWSINLPFLCNKCGKCCTLEDFLTAGEIKTKPEANLEVDAKVKTLFKELGKLWETSEAKYDEHIAHNPCPFLVNKCCSIYEIRPEGCRLFPKTVFGMQTQGCEPLNRFRRIRSILKKGRISTEYYYFTGNCQEPNGTEEPIRPAEYTKKQYQTCIAKLRKTGITDEELALFIRFNCPSKSQI